MAPILLFITAVVATVSSRKVKRYSRGQAAGKAAGKVASSIDLHLLYSHAAQAIFLVLPTISRRIGQSLQACTVYDAGDDVELYLAADHTISCDGSGTYDTMF
eukprot:CAMPEP_0182579332 /NCGR_PEP_ID=MMETSP1324-20130603/43891_1 /TAXON_ID=236786 /ORGANISM="Florenciella sp., Strain RCC1587" /LENGTH=102 /DNA_ID=CAMNT_0024795417 /DNA_START=67 /DNA_END=372 /DNA_ORIENTATION=+